MTGATGFIGSYIANSLIEKGHHVYALKGNNLAKATILSKKKIQTFESIKELNDSLISGEIKIDVVIHAATKYGKNKEKRNHLLWANYKLPLELYEVAKKMDVKCFINLDTSLPKYLNYYAKTKYFFRKYAQGDLHKTKLKFLNIRMHQVFGFNNDANNFSNLIIRDCFKGVKQIDITLGEQERDFFYVEDVSDCILFLINNLTNINNKYEEFELGYGNATPLRVFAELVKDLTNSKTQLRFGIKKYRHDEQMYSVADISKLTSLGWNPKYSLEDGLNRTIELYNKLFSYR